jgi:hypothetical protein
MKRDIEADRLEVVDEIVDDIDVSRIEREAERLFDGDVNALLVRVLNEAKARVE